EQELSNHCPPRAAKNRLGNGSGIHDNRSVMGFKTRRPSESLTKNVASARRHFVEMEFACGIGFRLEVRTNKHEAAASLRVAVHPARRHDALVSDRLRVEDQLALHATPRLQSDGADRVRIDRRNFEIALIVNENK